MERQNGRPGAGLKTPIAAGDARQPPASLGPYRVLSSLGGGRTGEVYLAEDERTSRRVALKRLRPEEPEREDERALVRREARAVARLSHPAIVQVLDVLEDDAGDCIVMELVEGRDLASLMAGGKVDVPYALRLGRELAEGLAEAHAKGLVHRDLKATNVVLTEDAGTAPGRVRILGFGLPAAPWLEDSLAVDDEEDMTIDSTESLERVRVLSPEQIAGHPVDYRTDLYALGVLLYEMLTGRPPFVGEDFFDTLLHIQSGPPPPVYKECPEAPLEADGLLQRMLAKNPSRRPPSARQVADELERLASAGSSPRPGGAASATPPPRKKSTGPVVRVLVRTDLVGTERWERMLGEERAAQLFDRHDREARELADRYGGHVAAQPSGLLLLFERSVDAVGFAVAYQQALARLSRDEPVHLSARLGVHQGEMEEGKAVRSLVERLKDLAASGQTLLTRAVFDEARGVALAGELADPHLRWVAHGAYAISGVEQSVALYEVGVKGLAPLKRPPETDDARPARPSGAGQTLGWRPAVGQAIPRCPSWELVERLEAEEHGESWLAAQASGETRVFSFSFAASRRRSFPFGVSRASAAELKAEEMKSEAAVG